MRVKEYEKVVKETPKFYPTFKIKDVPDWLEQHGVKKNDLFFIDPADPSTVIAFATSRRYVFHASKFEFFRYMEVKEIKRICDAENEKGHR